MHQNIIFFETILNFANLVAELTFILVNKSSCMPASVLYELYMSYSLYITTELQIISVFVQQTYKCT